MFQPLEGFQFRWLKLKEFRFSYSRNKTSLFSSINWWDIFYRTLKVVNLNLDPMTGKHKGFAFIWYDIPEAAQLAIEVMNSASMWGRPIKVGRPTQVRI